MSAIVAGALTGAAPAIATGLGAAGTQALGQGAGSLVAAMSPAARALRQQRKIDIERLKAGDLGFSAAQKQAMLRTASQGTAAQQGQASADLARREAAAGFGRSGLLAQERAQQGQTAAQALTQATGQVEAASTEQALAEKRRILQELAAQRGLVKQEATEALKGTVDTGAAATGYKLGKDTLAGERLAAANQPKKTE